MQESAPSILDLRDIVPPVPVPWWPPAPLAWALLGALLLGLGVAAVAIARARRSSAYRRAGLAVLADLERRLDGPGAEVEVVRAISRLLKRVALVAFPRETVAPLSGNEWLAFLDRTGGRGFVDGAGRVLPGAAYGGAAVASGEARALVQLARDWIRRHRC